MEINSIPSPNGEPGIDFSRKLTTEDIGKIEKLGYHPSTNIAEGVKKFVDWYKSYYHSERE